MIGFLCALALALSFAGPARADGLSALARLDPAASDVRAEGAVTTIDLALSQPVPWRLHTLDGPPRLVVEFRTLAAAGAIDGAGLARALRFGPDEEGWSRLIVDLTSPAEVAEAGLSTAATTGAAGTARLRLHLRPTDAETFAAAARPVPAAPAADPRPAASRPVVVLDPGHGGLDPGAEAGGLNEKALMLAYALELEELLFRGGLFDVALTRRSDEFVPLETRIRRARAAGADVFVSLHADELPEGAGAASGITVYTLDEAASDAASRRLAERHGKDDLLAGVRLAEPGDEIALVLLDLARTDTAPRSADLATKLKAAFRAEDLALVGRPLRSGAFSVLKAADFPSVLIELGFLSSKTDRDRLTDPEWRRTSQRAIEAALLQWALDDAARAGLRRR